ncbi:MAG: PilT/PilU family type 4a pilus ATPase [Acidobacteria bacterium]|nr:PilT/PilU family type 4a pilus ATPase [Acidobacteriota bacterium]
MIDLKSLLQRAVERKASDLHLKSGALPHLRVNGELFPLANTAVVSKEDAFDLVDHLLNSHQKEVLARKLEVDLSFGGDGLGRFRLAVFHQRTTLSLVFRVIPDTVPTMRELNLPEVLEEIAEEPRGLVLVTGTTGSGKSTCLAAMIRQINEARRSHIITIEDPIEFLFHDRVAFITQREISIDTEDFGSALRAALRQDPDVIMVGEMRDVETIHTAIQAAETGHLVMSTLHTTDTVETVNRMVTVFPAHQQTEIRLQFASALRAIICIRLIRSSVTGGRVPAVEVLRNTELIRSLIAQPERTKEIRRALEAGASQYRMQSFDQSILSLYQKGLISLNDALKNASSPDDLKLRMQGVVSSSEAV